MIDSITTPRNRRWGAFRRAWPWMLLTLILYASQLFAIIGSEFTMPVTLLQIPFVMAFLGFIYAIAYARETE